MNSTRDKKILKAFGENFKNIRIQKEISLRKLADEADVDFSQIHRIEKGESNPTLTMILSLAEGLKVNYKILMDFKENTDKTI